MDATEPVLRLSLLTARRRLVVEKPEAAAVCADSDEELLEQIRSGSETALGALFQRYYQLALSIGRNVLRDEGEAEDLVQDIFLQLHSRENTFDGAKGSARTWLVQMMYRRAFDRRTYLSRRHFYSGTDLEELTNAIQRKGSFEKDILDRLAAEQLLSEFDKLTERQQETLRLFFFEGFTLSETAERLEEDLKNVRHHYYRGIDRLRSAARAILRRARVNHE